ncbi:hypothetical protein IWW54_004994, partial [Coemansia sp. RSA 2705]
MSYNIFDVVLHPSLFQQHQQPGEAPYDYSRPASVPTSRSSTSCTRVAGARDDVAAPSWNDDDWAQIRQRLWNAKQHVGG